jgi:hypothetical protein
MIFLTQIPREDYENNISTSATYNQNDYIIGDTIIIPTIKEKINNLDEILDTSITQLNKTNFTSAITGSSNQTE